MGHIVSYAHYIYLHMVHVAVISSPQRLLDSISSRDHLDHPVHWGQLQTALQNLLSEAGDVPSLFFAHDYRQHSVITLSSTLKHKSKKLSRALEVEQEGGKRERGKGEGGGEGGKSEKENVIERVKEVKKTAQELKKEVCTSPKQLYFHIPPLSLSSPML